MATYLQLCQKLSRESGSVSGGATQPSSVTGQSGRLAKLVAWISDGWVDIQEDRKDWTFLQKKLTTSALITDNIEYMAASFGITDLGGWRDGPKDYSIYDPDLGAGDESFLRRLDYDDFYGRYLVGAQTAERPCHYAIGPDNSLCIGPKPKKAYVFNGRYRRAAQVLATNGDIPICPEQHDIILWRAMKKLHASDEAPTSFQFDDLEYNRRWANFVRAYTPRIGNAAGVAAGPLA